jgi:formylglycine-generating enzyme required for sulfatase activity
MDLHIYRIIHQHLLHRLNEKKQLNAQSLRQKGSENRPALESVTWFNSLAKDCRSAARGSVPPDAQWFLLGFRLCRNAE